MREPCRSLQRALAQSGPLTKIIFPVRGGRRRRHALPPDRRASAAGARSHRHRREPHRRRRPDRHQVGHECAARRHHDPDHHRPDHVPAADGGDEAELRSCARISCRSRCSDASSSASSTGPATDAKDFAQLVAWLKANPAKSSFGVPSNGTIPHFTGSRLEQMLGIPMTRVPYRGGAPIVKDLIGGASAVRRHHAGRRAAAASGRRPFVCWR